MPWLAPLNPPMRDWHGKRVWVVGASSGIGAGLGAPPWRQAAPADKPLVEYHALHLSYGSSPDAAAACPLYLAAEDHHVIQRFFHQYRSDLRGVRHHRQRQLGGQRLRHRQISGAGIDEKGAIGILTLTPYETAIIAADIATKTANVEIGFLDRFTGSVVISGDVQSVETALEAVIETLETMLGFETTCVTKT